MVRFGGWLVVMGCVEPGAAGLAAADGAERALPIGLRAGDVTPGGTTVLNVEGATPGDTVRFFVSPGGPGVGPCPAQLGGLCLDLGGAAPYLGSAVADASGVAVRRARIPSSVAPGSVVTFQAVAGGATTGTVRRTAGWANVGLVVDGDLSDWDAADERFATTSGVGAGWVTWDADAVYVAFDHPDVVAGGGQHWAVVYFGTGAPGATTGLTHGTQTPGLPFAANVAVRRKADGSFDSLEQVDPASGAWISTPSWLGTDGSAVAEGAAVELRIPRAVIGGDTVEVHLSWVFEGAGFESTYAGVPSDTFVDGYDPDATTYLVLDLGSPESPVVQNP